MKENFVMYQILDYFKQGKRLTVQTALKRFNTTELRLMVSRLKKAGHDIKSVWCVAESHGRKARFKEYFLATE